MIAPPMGQMNWYARFHCRKRSLTRGSERIDPISSEGSGAFYESLLHYSRARMRGVGFGLAKVHDSREPKRIPPVDPGLEKVPD